MATFQAQVEGITQITVGTTPTTGELTQFLQDGVKEVVTRIIKVRPDLAPLFSTTQTLDNTTTTKYIDSGIVISVVRENGTAGRLEPAMMIDPALRYRATDTDSLAYRSAYNPAWFIKNGEINVVPTPGASGNSAEVIYVAYPEPAFGDSGIGTSYAVATGVAGEADDERFTSASHPFVANDKVRLSGFAGDLELNGIEGTIDYIDANTFKLDNVTIDTDATGGTVEKVVSGFPSEHEYLVVLYASLRSLHAKMGFLSEGVTALTVASVPPDTPTLTASTVTLPGTVPVYATPTLTISGFAWDTTYPHGGATLSTALGDVKTATDRVNTNIWADAGNYSSGDFVKVKDAIDKAQALIDEGTIGGDTEPETAQYWLADEDSELVESAVTIAAQELQRATMHIKELDTLSQIALSEADGYIKQVQALLAVPAAQVADYNAKLQDALNEFNKQNVEYQAGIQKAIADAQAANQADVQGKLQVHQQEMAIYQASIGAEVQEYQTNIQADQMEYTWLQDQYTRLKSEYDAGFLTMAPTPPAQEAPARRNRRRE